MNRKRARAGTNGIPRKWSQIEGEFRVTEIISGGHKFGVSEHSIKMCNDSMRNTHLRVLRCAGQIRFVSRLPLINYGNEFEQHEKFWLQWRTLEVDFYNFKGGDNLYRASNWNSRALVLGISSRGAAGGNTPYFGMGSADDECSDRTTIFMQVHVNDDLFDMLNQINQDRCYGFSGFAHDKMTFPAFANDCFYSGMYIQSIGWGVYRL